MGMSDYLENILIDFVFRGVNYTPSENLYIALCTSVPNDADSGTTIAEVTGGNYERFRIPCQMTSWYSTAGSTSAPSNGSNGRTGNALAIEWEEVTWEDTVIAVAICDAPIGGNMLFYGELEKSKTVTAGSSIKFLINQLTYKIDD
jgi:hypothetical protein